jgi:flagellar basal-body rod protein FlgB
MALCLQTMSVNHLRAKMIKNLLFKNSNIPILTKGLDVYAIRHKVISGNIANVQTPGYKRKEVQFEEQLRNAMQNKIVGKKTNSKHFQIGGGNIKEIQPRFKVDSSTETYNGINNVDIEKEIIDQVKNELRFLYGSRMISRNFAAIRASIKGRYDI